jgi:chemotaxis family two-component system response regulator Rcp1
MEGRLLDILMVDDSPTDVLMTREALTDNQYKSLNVVEDGVEAIKYLRRHRPYENAVRPDLILLDLNLPKKDGREVLSELKSDERLKTIPVIILTTSAAEEDILTAYKNHANCYLTKPGDFNSFSELVKIIDRFWFSRVMFVQKRNEP